MLDKIIPGMLKKFFSENCLLEQGFVKDPSVTLKSLLEAKSKELGDTLSIRRYVRFGLGE
jgi:elongation factor Ts